MSPYTEPFTYEPHSSSEKYTPTGSKLDVSHGAHNAQIREAEVGIPIRTVKPLDNDHLWKMLESELWNKGN